MTQMRIDERKTKTTKRVGEKGNLGMFGMEFLRDGGFPVHVCKNQNLRCLCGATGGGHTVSQRREGANEERKELKEGL